MLTHVGDMVEVKVWALRQDIPFKSVSASPQS
jgi:hypothetical protein